LIINMTNMAIRKSEISNNENRPAHSVLNNH